MAESPDSKYDEARQRLNQAMARLGFAERFEAGMLSGEYMRLMHLVLAVLIERFLNGDASEETAI